MLDALAHAFSVDMPLSALIALGGLASLSLVALTLAWVQRQRLRRLHQKLENTRSELGLARTQDPLTGLPTRVEADLALGEAVAESDRRQTPLCVLCLGVDGFRGVNGAYGHEVGDALLRQLAQRLSSAAEPHFIARLPGDEFQVIAPLGLDEARRFAQQLLEVGRRELSSKEHRARLSLSVGLACYPDPSSHRLLATHATLAMRSVKLGGGNAYAAYETWMGIDQREQFALRNDLRDALERGQFELLYQPKVDAQTLQVSAAEALLRWNHPQRGMVSPATFIPVAERHGLIQAIGDWVIEEACRQAAQWRDQGLRMRVAVNLSGLQVRQDDLVDRLTATLHRHNLRPARFTCEITESVAMEDTAVTQRTFDRLRQAGLHVSIDDFGTGHSSLAWLRRLPAAELKIDRAFVADVAESEQARTIAGAIVRMAHSLGLRVVAEGVETSAQCEALVALGCDELQGYLFARPMPAHALALWASDEGTAERRAFRDSLFEATGTAPLDDVPAR